MSQIERLDQATEAALSAVGACRDLRIRFAGESASMLLTGDTDRMEHLAEKMFRAVMEAERQLSGTLTPDVRTTLEDAAVDGEMIVIGQSVVATWHGAALRTARWVRSLMIEAIDIPSSEGPPAWVCRLIPELAELGMEPGPAVRYLDRLYYLIHRLELPDPDEFGERLRREAAQARQAMMPTAVGPDDPPAANNHARRGRLPRQAAAAMKTRAMAILARHPTLTDSPAELADKVGVSERTARRWISDLRRRWSRARPDAAE